MASVYIYKSSTQNESSTTSSTEQPAYHTYHSRVQVIDKPLSLSPQSFRKGIYSTMVDPPTTFLGHDEKKWGNNIGWIPVSDRICGEDELCPHYNSGDGEGERRKAGAKRQQNTASPYN